MKIFRPFLGFEKEILFGKISYSVIGGAVHLSSDSDINHGHYVAYMLDRPCMIDADNTQAMQVNTVIDALKSTSILVFKRKSESKRKS